ncbi:MAG: hypothetical protein RL736_393, partial [Pseudomonadota bacterium]
EKVIANEMVFIKHFNYLVSYPSQGFSDLTIQHSLALNQ